MGALDLSGGNILFLVLVDEQGSAVDGVVLRQVSSTDPFILAMVGWFLFWAGQTVSDKLSGQGYKGYQLSVCRN